MTEEIIVMYCQGHGEYKPIEENPNKLKQKVLKGEAKFKFRVGDKIKSKPTGKYGGTVSQLVFQNGYYWYDFTDGESIRLDSQDYYEIEKTV